MRYSATMPLAMPPKRLSSSSRLAAASEGMSCSVLSRCCGRASLSSCETKRVFSHSTMRSAQNQTESRPRRLKLVWKIARIIAGSGRPQPLPPSHEIPQKKTGSKTQAIAAEERLKMKCAAATRFAFDVASSTASMPVTVVPIFAPMTMAAPVGRSISPPETAESAMAIEALEDCAMAVISSPAKTNRT